MLALHQQPVRWRELQNPMAMLPHQASVNDCPLMTMTPGAEPAALISNSMRGRLRSKERKLKALPGYRYHLASGEAEIKRLLDAFFRIKPLRMAEQKLPNVFAEPGVEDFIRDACLAPLAGGGHAIDIHALECDAEVIAIFAGVADGHRFSMMFNTYTMSENAKHSPGLILMRDIVDHYAGLGYRALDLGIGSDDYKRLFCKSDEPIFDSFIALTARGKTRRGGDVRHQSRQARREAQSGAAADGAETARRVSLGLVSRTRCEREVPLRRAGTHLANRGSDPGSAAHHAASAARCAASGERTVADRAGRHDDPRAGIDGVRRQRRLAQHGHVGEADRLSTDRTSGCARPRPSMRPAPPRRAPARSEAPPAGRRQAPHRAARDRRPAAAHRSPASAAAIAARCGPNQDGRR